MPLNFKTEDQIVSELVAAFASKIPGLQPYLIPGDPLLALAEGDATQINWLQALCKAIYIFSRASTAQNEDLDSWMNDFGFLRLAATKAKGQVELSLNTARTYSSVVPVGKIVQTLGGAIQYQIIQDNTQSAWSDAFGGYVFQAGQTSIIVTAEALVAGSAYNVQPGQLAYFASSGTNADKVVNLASITNGVDAESDDQFRQRFILWINSLSKNTRPSIQAAVMSVEQGLNFNLAENTDQNGNPRNGFFTVVVDDGSGNTPQPVLDLVTAAVEAVRGFTIEYTVVRATKLSVSASLNIKVNSGVSAQPIQQKVVGAIVDYINALKIGQTLYVYDLIGIALNADPNVLAVQVGSALVNSSEADVSATIFQVIRTVPSSVTVGTF